MSFVSKNPDAMPPPPSQAMAHGRGDPGSCTTGKARFVKVQDGSHEVPALVFSVGFAQKLNGAISANHNEQRERTRLTEGAKTVTEKRIDAEAWADSLKYRIKLKKKRVRYQGLNEELSAELGLLMKEGIYIEHQHARINRKDEALLAEMKAAEAKSRASWAEVDAVLEKIWGEENNGPYPEGPLRATGINNAGEVDHALILSAKFVAKTQAAIRAGRDHRLLERKARVYSADVPNRKIESESRIERISYQIKLKKKELKHKGLDAQQLEELEQLMRERRQSQHADKLIDTNAAALEKEVKEAERSWLKAWGDVGAMIDSVWTHNGIVVESLAADTACGQTQHGQGSAEASETQLRTAEDLDMRRNIRPELRQSFIAHIEAKKDAYTKALDDYDRVAKQQNKFEGYGVSTARGGERLADVRQLYREGVWRPRVEKHGARAEQAHKIYKEAMQHAAEMVGLEQVPLEHEMGDPPIDVLDDEGWIQQYFANDLRTAAWRQNVAEGLQVSIVDRPRSRPTHENLDFLHESTESLAPSDGLTGIEQRHPWPTEDATVHAQGSQEHKKSPFERGLQKLEEEARQERLGRYLDKVQGHGAAMPHDGAYIELEKRIVAHQARHPPDVAMDVAVDNETEADHSRGLKQDLADVEPTADIPNAEYSLSLGYAQLDEQPYNKIIGGLEQHGKEPEVDNLPDCMEQYNAQVPSIPRLATLPAQLAEAEVGTHTGLQQVEQIELQIGGVDDEHISSDLYGKGSAGDQIQSSNSQREAHCTGETRGSKRKQLIEGARAAKRPKMDIACDPVMEKPAFEDIDREGARTEPKHDTVQSIATLDVVRAPGKEAKSSRNLEADLFERGQGTSDTR